MREVIFLFVCFFVFEGLAHEGVPSLESSVPFIKVKAINRNGVKESGSIEFYGEEAGKFLKLLPAVESILHVMVPKDVAEQMVANERTLKVVSKNWMLNFECAAGKLNVDFEKWADDAYKHATYTKKSPKCTITFGPTIAEDSFPMIPKDYEKNMCK